MSGTTSEARELAEEVPVAFVYNGETHAVLMATPEDLEDFATGFTLTEGILKAPDAVEALEIVRHAEGIELRLSVPGTAATALRARRRASVGPVGCGLCGIESLEQAVPPPPAVTVSGPVLSPDMVVAAVEARGAGQRLHRRTGAVHAAGYWVPETGCVAVREDVGRHNAVDKLSGAIARGGAVAPGALLLTSRVSVELVQKAAAMGVGCILAVSAPTALAVRVAEAAGLTLVANVRRGGYGVHTHPHRVREPRTITAVEGSSRA